LTSWVESALSVDGRFSSVIVARVPAQKREAKAMLVEGCIFEGYIRDLFGFVVRSRLVIVG
jgi:hypothetical protein